MLTVCLTKGKMTPWAESCFLLHSAHTCAHMQLTQKQMHTNNPQTDPWHCPIPNPQQLHEAVCG